MARPTVGGSDGTWGTELNAYLDVSLDTDGKVDDGAAQTTSAAPTADAELANKKYVVDQIAAAVAGSGFFKADGSTVFNTTMTAANTFQDLDLSSYVGSNTALVYLEVKAVTGDVAYACKPKGFGGTYESHNSGTGFANGASYAHPDANNNYFYVVCATDSSGVMQHAAANNTTTFTIKLIGYVG